MRLPLAFLLLSFCTVSLRAQLPTSELSGIYPPVVKAGSTVELTLEGTSLEGLEKLWFTTPGITAKAVMLPQSPFRKNQYQNGNRFTLTVPAETPSGQCEVRAVAHYGATNSRKLTILPTTSNLLSTEGSHELTSAPDLPVEAHAIGKFDANKIDFYKVSLKKGQRLIAVCQSGTLDSTSDATLVLKDGQGEVLKRTRDYDYRDALLDYTASVDETLYLGAYDFTFKGGSPYHLHITVGPHIDAVFPPSGKAGTTGSFTIFGRNLPGGSLEGGHEWNGELIETAQVSIALPTSTPFEPQPGMPVNSLDQVFPFQIKESNAFPLILEAQPTLVRTGKGEFEKVNLPAAVSGYFKQDETAGHRYRFTAAKDKSYQIQVAGDDIRGRIDPYLVIEKITVAADGKETLKVVKEQDDFSMGSRSAFPNISRDPRIVFKADADGDYQVTILDQYKTEGFASIYRLSVQEAVPDFDLIANVEKNIANGNTARPSAIVLRKNGSYLVQIEALRRGGFDGAIEISAKELPENITLPPTTIPEGKTTTYAIFQATENAATWDGVIQLIAKATINGQEVVKPIRSASIINPVTDFNKIRLRTRLESEIALSVLDDEIHPASITPKAPGPLTVEIGQKLEVPFNFSANKEVKGNVVVTPLGFPTMKKPPAVNVTADKKEGKLTISFAPTNDFKPTPGQYELVIRGLGTLGKFQHFPERVEQLKEDQQLITEKIKALKPEEAELRKQADAEKKKIDAELKAATAVSKEKDMTFGVYSAPIPVTVTAAPEKKK